jgi:regulator of sigma E protease
MVGREISLRVALGGKMLLNLIYFIIVLGILVFVHELGHFIVARFAGVKILTFSLGFGKKLVRFKRGETEYAVSAVPLGGYVKMLGESTDDVVAEEDASRSFSNKSPLARMCIVFAGPFFNVLFAVAVFFTMFLTGYPTPSDSTKVGEVIKGEPAAEAGLRSGDVITRIDDVPVHEFTEIHDIVNAAGSRPLVFQIERDGRTFTVRMTPRLAEDKNAFGEITGRSLRIGVGRSLETKRDSIGKALPNAVIHTVDITVLTVIGIGKLISGSISRKNLGGPILIYQQVGQQAKAGLSHFLNLLAVISISLGVFNLFPIPILDGSHILFAAIEMVVRRRIPDKTVEFAQKVGLAILICIMVLATFNDITRFFHVK